MIFLTKHENQAAYDAVKDNLATPQVALIADSMSVHYKPYIDPCQIHDYVDLGLPSGTKWATKNVGACSETDYGNYYQYGKGADTYQVTSGQSDYSGTENPLAATADTATVEWGDGWHMPTQAQLNELTANTTYEWTTIDGVNGGKFTHKTDSSKYIFIPAAGRYIGGSLYDVGNGGCLWSSTPDGGSKACSLSFYNGGKDVLYGYRRYGYSVRPVLDA